jgi:penicillin-binding protein 1C
MIELLKKAGKKRPVRWAGAGLLASAALFTVLSLLFPLRVSKEYSQLVFASDGTVLHAFLTGDDKWRMYTRLDEITPELRRAILFKEDRYFYRHFGINPVSIARALYNNSIRGRKTSGASTITMQVARLLDPAPRTYTSKVVEMFRALQLEWKYSKEEILQLYLNLVPYGGNIEGVKAASLLYYGELPTALSISRVATLSIIPNRPTSLKPGRSDEMLQKERDRWLRRYLESGLFTPAEVESALSEPLGIRRREAPHQVPHFAQRIRSQYPGMPLVYTTLDWKIQQQVETIAASCIMRLKTRNIHNAAVLIISNRTREVAAYLGNPDYTDREFAGQVDGVRAVRSPGSTLKPLIYGLAMDRGLVTPRTVITDVPANFEGYAPENFDSRYNGNVTIERALAYSLNIPAVKVLDRLGPKTLIDRLSETGFSQVKKDGKKLGLSVALGGCGVRVDEMAALYAAFPNNGVWKPLKWLRDEKQDRKVQVVTAEAGYLISNILTQLSRPDLPNNYQSSIHVPRVAWKTGTSYGRRDAWSIGFNKKYTIAVWIGNFSGIGVPELTGADMATPLLFDLFNTLDYNSSNEWLSRPSGLAFRFVCPETGLPPGDFCRSSVLDQHLPSVSTNVRCDHLKEMHVSINEDFTYCTTCLPANGYRKKLYPNLAPELIAFYESEKVGYQRIPAHNSACSRVFREKEPVITSPVSHREYLVEKTDPQGILLACNADNEVKTVYWYINDRFYKSGLAGDKIFFTPGAGKVKISCSDDRGRNTDCLIDVKYY